MRVSHRCIHDCLYHHSWRNNLVVALPPSLGAPAEFECSLRVFALPPSLGAPAEFWHSSRVWALRRASCHVGRPVTEPVLLCFIDPRVTVRKIRNEASSCLGIFSSTLRFYYVASSPGSPLPHLLDGHKKIVGCSAIPVRSYFSPWARVCVCVLLVFINSRVRKIRNEASSWPGIFSRTLRFYYQCR